MWSRIACFAALLASCHAGLLGAGTGEGSCAAAPFRANPSALKYTVCPQYASCCSEFGYCRPKSEWDLGVFRDCNGVSNGRALEEGAIIAENAAAANGDARGLALLNIPAGGSVPTAAGAPIPAPAPAVVAAAPAAPAVAVAAAAPAAAGLALAPGAAGLAVGPASAGLTLAPGAAGLAAGNGLVYGTGLAGGALVGAGGALVGAGAGGAVVAAPAGGAIVGANGALIGGAGLVGANGALVGANGAIVGGNGALIGANGAYAINGAGAYGLSGLWDGYFGGAGLTGYGLPVVKKA